MSADKKAIGARPRRERKQRRMTVEDLAEAFRDHTPERDRRHLPKLRDLCRMIRGYEAGEHAPGPRYRLLYCAAFGVDEDWLFNEPGPAEPPWRAGGIDLNGSFTPDDAERMTLAVQRPARLDTRVVESLSTILAAQRRTEDVVGSGPMVEAATSHLQLILELLREARGALANDELRTSSRPDWKRFPR